MDNQTVILIVDDEASIRRLCQRLLHRKNVNTLEAKTGKEGYNQIEEHAFAIHAVLLDLNLPDGSGTEWATKYRELHSELPIIFFTGSSAPPECTTHSQPLFYFLKKPFTPTSMFEVLQKVLG